MVGVVRTVARTEGDLLSRRQRFIDNSMELFDDRFDYSKLDYRGRGKKGLLTCIAHNHTYETRLGNHLACPYGACPKCREDAFVTELNNIYKRQLEDKFKGKITTVGDIVSRSAKALFNCKVHGRFEKTPHNVLWSNHGCHECALERLRSPRPCRENAPNNGAVNWSKIKRDPVFAAKDAVVYLIRIYREGDDFFKVGVSNKNSFYFRYRRHCKYGEVVLINYIEMPMLEAYELEQFILEETERYYPKYPFEGKTECFLSESSKLASCLEPVFALSKDRVNGKRTRYFIGEQYAT